MKPSIVLWTSISCCLASYAAAYGEPDTKADIKASAEIGKTSRPLQDGEILTFKDFKSKLCIGVDHASTANGALVKQFNCDGAPNQRWRTVRAGAIHRFKNVKSGLCIGVDGASVNPGANIGQYNCSAGLPTDNNQGWTIQKNPDEPAWNLHNAKSDRCIGVDHASTANGAQLKQFDCDHKQNQEWEVTLVNE